MELDRDALLEVFVAEADESLLAMEEAILVLESAPRDSESIETVFRIAHTLKGSAATLGVAPLEALAHALETLLDRVRSGGVDVTGDVGGLLLEAVDAFRTILPFVGKDGEIPDEAGLVRRLRSAAASDGGADGAEGGAGSPPAEAAGGDEADDGDGDVREAPEADDDASRSRRGRGSGGASIRSGTLRVGMEKLDRLLDLAGEITIARGRLTDLLESGEARGPEEILEMHRESDRLHMELQELVMELRLVPLGATFRQQIRTVRDVAGKAGKLAHLVIEGEDVEVDTTVAEHLRDPLTHAIRNAIDHGIEYVAERRAAGKEPSGEVRIRARHEAGTVVVEVSDDGGGIDRKRFEERVRAMGVDPEGLSDEALFQWVFEPGFSTADEVTELSGRGVGLDVVRKNIEALRGTVEIESRPGRGTTLTMRVPLTVAVIDGFSVGVGEESFVIPLDNVMECIELPAGRLHDGGRDGVLDLRGEPLPFVRLRKTFDLEAAVAPGRENVVVVRHGPRKAGLVVDELKGEAQAVIKPLGTLFPRLPGIGSATIMGSGRVALILDVPALVRDVESVSGVAG